MHAVPVRWITLVSAGDNGSVTLTERDVRQALDELGRLRFGVVDLEQAMRDIVRTTHAVFNVDGAALMLTDSEHRLKVAAVSDSRIEHLEQLQLRHDEGPCLDAYVDHQVVRSEDLVAEPRWPAFGPAAVTSGLRAVLASPIPFERQPIGVVVVVSYEPRPWTPQGELALVAFTDLVALLIATTLYAEEQSELAAGLHVALDARDAVTRAAALLAEQEGVSLRAGEQRLKAMARRRGCPVTELAAQLNARGSRG